MQNIFKELLAPTWQQRQQALGLCTKYYNDDRISTENQQQLIHGYSN